MILDRASASLRIVLGEAKVTANCDIVACYATTLGAAFSVGLSQTASNGTTPVTVVSAPAAGAQCQVSELRVFNNDNIAHVVTLQLIDGVAQRVIMSAAVAPGSAFIYTPQAGVAGGASGGSSAPLYVLPAASVGVLGGVRVDGTTLANTAGAISVSYGTAANTAAQGNDARILAAQTAAQVASAIAANPSGFLTAAPVVSVAARTGAVTLTHSDLTDWAAATAAFGTGYTLPTASTSVLGGVKVDGSSVTISGGGVISTAITGITPLMAYLGQL